MRRTWPAALTINSAGRLELDGVDLVDLAGEYGTPLWVISRSTVETNFTSMLATFRARYARSELAYSVKAHNTLAVLRLLHQLGAKIDCSSEYEFELALRCGVPPTDIILNGNGKSDSALRAAASRRGVRQVNVDSLGEVGRLQEHAAASGTRVPCVVRVQLTYAELLRLDPSFSTTLRVGEGKFGSNLASGQALETIRAVIDASHLDFLGLSHHVGFSGYMSDYSIERELMHHEECVREMCELADYIARSFGVSVTRLDLGGGFRAGASVLLSTPGAGQDGAYYDLPTLDAYARAIFDSLERHSRLAEPPLVQFESGGYQIANAVLLLAEVSEVKDVRTAPRRRYVAVDASMMMFTSRGTMRLGHPIVAADRPDALAEDWPVEVVGQTCVYDSIAEDIRLPHVSRGDILAILHQGAYCETESTQFGAFPRPMVVMVESRDAHIVKRRETIADICSRDLLPDGVGG